jgi:hypothetical protein
MSFAQQTFVSGVGSSAGATLGASTPVNNFIVVMVDWDDGFAFSSISDDAVNAYTQVGTEHDDNFTKSRLYWARNGTAGVRTVTLVVGGGSGFTELLVGEWSGISTGASPIDSFLYGAVGSQAPPSNVTLTTTTANTLAIGVGFEGHATATITTAGYTTRSTASNHVLADKTISPPGATQIVFDNSSTGNTFFNMWSVGLIPTGGAVSGIAPSLMTLGVGV